METAPKKKRGERVGYNTVYHVKKARKDHKNSAGDIIVAKGQEYWWWQWAFRPRQISLTKPTYLDAYPHTVSKTWEELKSRAEDAISNEEFDEELLDELNSFKEERDEAIQNLEQYFEGSCQLETMREMVEEIDGVISELETLNED